MKLIRFFEKDDGSLPEIEIDFREPAHAVLAFKHLFDLGARDVSLGSATVWIVEEERERPFAGASDAEQLAAGEIQPFHVVLGGVQCGGTCLPDLGVWLDSCCFVLDYRMGREWGPEQVKGLVQLLRQMADYGGTITVPWWGSEGECAFQKSINSA